MPGLVIPAEDDLGEQSLWQQDIGMGESQVANITAGIPLRPVDIAWSVV